VFNFDRCFGSLLVSLLVIVAFLDIMLTFLTMLLAIGIAEKSIDELCFSMEVLKI